MNRINLDELERLEAVMAQPQEWFLLAKSEHAGLVRAALNAVPALVRIARAVKHYKDMQDRYDSGPIETRYASEVALAHAETAMFEALKAVEE